MEAPSSVVYATVRRLVVEVVRRGLERRAAGRTPRTGGDWWHRGTSSRTTLRVSGTPSSSSTISTASRRSAIAFSRVSP